MSSISESDSSSCLEFVDISALSGSLLEALSESSDVSLSSDSEALRGEYRGVLGDVSSSDSSE